MSQTDLAEKLGVAQSYVSRVEGGLENVTLSTCERFANALGCHYSIKFAPWTVVLDLSGLGNVTLSTCERFAHALGCDYSSEME